MPESYWYCSTKIHQSDNKAINWDNPDPKDFSPELSVTIHMVSLVKETSNLYKVTVKYLPIEVARKIMGDIFIYYNKRLEEEFKKIDFFSSAGKSR